MSTSAPDSSAGRHRFAFVVNRRPAIYGSVGAVVILFVGYGWSWWTGRIHSVDATFIATMIAWTTLVPAFMLRRTLRNAQQWAASFGHIEVGDIGARWSRPDGTFGFDVPWSEVDRATFDLRNSTVLLFPSAGGTGAFLGALGQYGTPSGFVVLERFEQLVSFISAKVQTSAHDAGANRSRAAESTFLDLVAKRTLLLGAASCVTAAGVYAANLALQAHFGWNRLLLPTPLLIGATGVLAIIAGLRIRTGTGPQISPLYSPDYRVKVLRFLAVASAANFVLVGVVNAFAL